MGLRKLATIPGGCLAIWLAGALLASGPATAAEPPAPPPATPPSVKVVPRNDGGISITVSPSPDRSNTTRRAVPAERPMPADPAYNQLLRIASRQVTQGQHAAALETYRQMLKLYPGDPIATRGEAEVLVALGRLPEAESLLKEALSNDAGDQGLRQTLAEIHRSQEKYDLVLEDVVAMLGKTEKGQPLPMAWAEKMMEELAGQPAVADKIEPAIRKLLTERKDRPEVRLLLAEVLIRKGEVDAAYLEVTEADRGSNAGGELLFQFADGLYSQGLSQMAGNAYRRAAEAGHTKDTQLRAWNRATEVAVEGERWDEAILAYRGLAAVDPKSPAATDALLAVADLQQSRLRNYQAALDTYHALEPNLSPDRLGKLYLQMADCYLRMNRLPDAKEWLAKVKGSQADQETQAEAAFLNAEMLFFSGDFTAAQAAYEDLAQNFTRTRKTNDAVGRFLQIVKFKDLGQQDALKVYARMEEANRMGDTTAVIDTAHQLQQAYATTDLAADALVREAEVVRQRHQAEAAVLLCQRAADEHPKARVAPYSLSLMGYILMNDLNSPKRAQVAWERLLAGYPENMLAAQIRRTVERLRKNNES